MKYTIYYFSGTGNSLAVARKIAEGLESAEVLSISRLIGNREIHSTGDVVGFVFPVYLHVPPKQVVEFISKIIFSGNPFIFSILTMNGDPGRSNHIIRNILKKKKQKLNYSSSVLMPGNCIIADGFTNSEKIRNQRLNESPRKIAEITRNIQSKKENTSVNEDSIISTIITASLFWIVKNIIRPDRKFHTNGNCTLCGNCAKVCPAGNIEITGKVQWKKSCEYCMACIHWCPGKAIEIDKGTESRLRYHHPDVTVKEISYR